MRSASLVLAVTLITLSAPASAVLYSFTNAEGQYVISQKPPKDKSIQYAVLSDDGKFIRMVQRRDQQLPISHWRPWFIPKEPHPYDADPDLFRDREPVITIEEEEERVAEQREQREQSDN